MRLLGEPTLPPIPARLPPPALPPGVKSIDDLAKQRDHPERGRWLAEWEWRESYNAKIDAMEERLRRCSVDILEFAKEYFPETFTAPFCDFHRELMDLFFEMPEDVWHYKDNEGEIRTKQGIVAAAPRGHAKSTLLTFLIPIYCAAFRLKKFVLILSDSDEQVRTFCAELKKQIEENERLKADFGEMSGLHYSGMRWTGRDFDVCHAETDENGVMKVVHRTHIAGRSFHARLRGIKSGADRPDLILGDDCENDERVRTLEQRNKLEEDLNKKVIPMLDPITGLFVFCGTILHFDSLLSRLLSQRLDRTYVQKIWRCIKQGRDIFDKSAIPLWPERFTLKYLQEKRLSMTEGQFNTEWMNDPHDPSTRQFFPEWIQWYHRGTHLRYNTKKRCFEWNKPGHHNPLTGEEVWQKLLIFQAVDPAIGETARNDYFAMITAGIAEQTRDVVLLDLVNERMNFADQVATVLHQFNSFPETMGCAIEATGYQEALYQTILRRQAKKYDVKKVPLKPIKIRNGINQKVVRLQRRSWDVQTGTIWFAETLPGDKGYEDAVTSEETPNAIVHRVWMRLHPLYMQMMEFPKSRNDDALDAFDMLLEVMGRRLLQKARVEEDEEETSSALQAMPAINARGGATTNIAIQQRRTSRSGIRRGGSR